MFDVGQIDGEADSYAPHAWAVVYGASDCAVALSPTISRFINTRAPRSGSADIRP